MRKVFSFSVVAILFGVFIINHAVAATYLMAQHRVPPVVTALDIPHTVQANIRYRWRWTVMGYHDSYDMMITVESADGALLYQSVGISPENTSDGSYSYDSSSGVRSHLFTYSTTFEVPFISPGDLVVRLFASPNPDSIDTTFLSCLIPSGLGYRVGDRSGRKISISGIVSSSDQSRDVYLNSLGTSYLMNPGGSERGWAVTTGSTFHTGVDLYSDDWNWQSGTQDYGRTFYETMGGKVVFAGIMNDVSGNPQAANSAWFGNQVIVYNESFNMAVRYAHLSSIGVKLNDDVAVGQVIGQVGNSGRRSQTETGPVDTHLHITLYKNIDSTALSFLKMGRWPTGTSVTSAGASTYRTPFKYLGDQ